MYTYLINKRKKEIEKLNAELSFYEQHFKTVAAELRNHRLLKNQVDQLKSDVESYRKLYEKAFDDLQESGKAFNILESEFEALEADYDELRTDYNELETLEADYDKLIKEYNELEADYLFLKDRYEYFNRK